MKLAPDVPRLSLEILLGQALLEGLRLALRSVLPEVLGGVSTSQVEAPLFVGLAVLLVGWRITCAARRRPTLAIGPEASRAAGVSLSPEAREASEAEQAEALVVTTALARALDVAEAASAVNDALQRSSRLERTAVLLYNNEDGVCRFVGWRGLSPEYRRAVEGHCPWKHEQPEAEPIVVQDVHQDAGLAPYRELLEGEGIGALAFIPIMGKSGVVGKLMLYGPTPGSITPASVRAAHITAVSFGAAVTRLRMAGALTRSESRLRAVIDTAMDAVVSMDREGRVTGWNVQAETTFGWTAGEALGRLLEELVIPEELRVAHREGLARYSRTGASTVLGRRIEVPALRKDGTRIMVELAISRVRTARGVVFSGFLRDITKAKRAAEELVEARTAAEAANRAKTEFLANMSHEIRTPLTAILGYAELLRDDGDLARAPERRLATIDTIQGAGQHLLTVINDILDISKIEAGKMTVEALETPILSVLREVNDLLLPRAAEKGVGLTTRLTSPVPERILSDPTRLRQILMNLAGNAVKFTEQGSVVIVAGTEERDGAQHLVIEVEDTGPGLTPTQATHLFTAFGQADASVTRRHGGSGLGLTISHRLAQLLGGSVTLARTVPGQGSCFRLDLPLVPVAGVAWLGGIEPVVARALPRSAEAASDLVGRILLAEDGRDNQFLIAFHLRKAGAEVEVANNGREALAQIERATAEGRPFGLLLTDIQMPEMDGYTLVRTLRSCGSPLAVVALTAHAMAEDRQKCLDAGCDDYLVKPINKEHLLGTCAKWLRKDSGVAAA